MKDVLQIYNNLTKFGIVVFVLITGVIGYLLGFRVEQTFSVYHLLSTVFGLYFLSSGSLALNQVQEYKIDALMKRTSGRPIPSGKMSWGTALFISLVHLILGGALLWSASFAAFWTGVATVVLYNGFYTMWWKRTMVFAAVPGAIPGALPVVIGFAANNSAILEPECVYAFLIMFLWQMPHFWTLAIKYKDDYAEGHIPVMPAILGVQATLFHIGLYLFVYLLMALASPWFLQSSALYLLLILPFSIKVMIEFFKYFNSMAEKRWLPFFLWTNLSMLVFLIVPVADRWNFLL